MMTRKAKAREDEYKRISQDKRRHDKRDYDKRRQAKTKAREAKTTEDEYPVSYTHLTLPTTPYV